MKKQIYQSLDSTSNQKLRDVFLSDPELFGEVLDARICNYIAGDLYDLRKAAGLTQERLAQIMGVKQSNISRWETPGYQGYKVKMLSKIVRLLGGRLSIHIEPRANYSSPLRFSARFARPQFITTNTTSKETTHAYTTLGR